mgnify:CR=1 FL=1
MINFALLPAPANQLNEFTATVLTRCLRDGFCMVECRNGMILKVGYKPITEGDNEDPLFFANDWAFCFEANGESTKNSQWDLIEIVESNG